MGGGSPDHLFQFESALGVSGPAYAEYQYLMKGFGYGVYKEGFDIVFHYEVRLPLQSFLLFHTLLLDFCSYAR